MGRLTWAAWRGEYAFAYRWLMTHCAPWRWLASAALLPGSPAWRAALDLRDAVVSGVRPTI